VLSGHPHKLSPTSTRLMVLCCLLLIAIHSERIQEGEAVSNGHSPLGKRAYVATVSSAKSDRVPMASGPPPVSCRIYRTKRRTWVLTASSNWDETTVTYWHHDSSICNMTCHETLCSDASKALTDVFYVNYLHGLSHVHKGF
jgi:hypothetical protein